MTVYDGAHKSNGSDYRMRLDKESQSGKAHSGPCAVHRGMATVGRLRTLAQNVRIFIARGCPDYSGDLSEVFSLNIVGTPV